MLGCLAFSLPLSLFEDGPPVGIAFGIVFGLPIATSVALYVGGAACIQHLILRRMLSQQNDLPWKLVQFLDFAVERIILHRIGGHYVFIHRSFLDYFTTM